MNYEYEARFCDLDISRVTAALRESGARCVLPRTLQRRVIFENDVTCSSRSWLRLRSNGRYTTLTLKRAEGDTPSLESIREIETGIADFEAARELLAAIGLTAARYQENYREEWKLDDITFDIDEWPALPPFLEIEGPTPHSVRAAAVKLGLDFATATFGSVDELYKERLGWDILSQPELVFDDASAV